MSSVALVRWSDTQMSVMVREIGRLMREEDRPVVGVYFLPCGLLMPFFLEGSDV